MDETLQKKPVDTRPYVLINVSNSKEQIFYSSDPLEIQKHNLNGLAIGSLIDINNVEYVIRDLAVSIYNSPMKATTNDGRDVSYICEIKLKVQDK